MSKDLFHHHRETEAQRTEQPADRYEHERGTLGWKPIAPPEAYQLPPTKRSKGKHGIAKH